MTEIPMAETKPFPSNDYNHATMMPASNAMAFGTSELLEGAREISDYLKCLLGPNWSERRVRYLVDTNAGWPIWKEKGIGLVARKSSLIKFLDKREATALGESQ
jgi:hypothetical protein